MSKLDKIAGRTRKPVAVILSTLMVLSTTPVVPLAAVSNTVAFADGSAKQEQGKSQFVQSQTWSAQGTPTVQYDLHPVKGEDGSGVLTIKKSDVQRYLLGNADLLAAVQAENVYTQGGSDQFSQQIDGKDLPAIEKIEQGKLPKTPSGADSDYFRKVTDVKVAGKPRVTAVKAVNLSDFSVDESKLPAGVKLTEDKVNYYLTTTDDADANGFDATLAFKVKKVEFSYELDYSYMLPVDQAKLDAYYGTDEKLKTKSSGTLSSDQIAGRYINFSASRQPEVVALDLADFDASKDSQTFDFQSLVLNSSLVKKKAEEAAQSDSEVQDGIKAKLSELAGKVNAGLSQDVTAPDSDRFFAYQPDSIKQVGETAATPTGFDVDESKIKDVNGGYSVSLTKNAGGSIKSITLTKTDDKAKAPKLTVGLYSLAYSYQFDYQYTLQADLAKVGAYYQNKAGASTQPFDGSVSYDRADDGSLADKLSSTISFKNYWAALEAGHDFSTLKDTAISDDLTYSGKVEQKKTYQLLKTVQGLKGAVKDAPDAKYFKLGNLVQSDDGFFSIDVTTGNAVAAGQTFKIAWSYPDGTPVEGASGEQVVTTVELPQIKKKAFDLSTQIALKDAFPYRLADDELQQTAIKDALNAQVQALTSAYGSEVKDYFKAVSITNTSKYYANPEAGATLDDSDYTVEFSKDGGALDNYIFTADGSSVARPQVTIEKMDVQDWSGKVSDTSKRLTVTGEGLGGTKTLDGSNQMTWVRSNPVTMRWQGGTIASNEISSLSDAVKVSQFEGSFSYKSALPDGKQSASFFVRDENGTIHRIENVSYLMDTTAPTLNQLRAVPEGTSFKSADKKVLVAKNMDVQVVSTEGDETATRSGINRVDVSYTEQGSGKAVSPKALQDMKPSSRVEGGTNTYQFGISADSKVSSDSIKVNLQDRAGNENNGLTRKDTQLPAELDVDELLATTSAPTISTAWSTTNAHNGKYYNENRTLTVTVHAPFFEYLQQYSGDQAVLHVYKNGALSNTLTVGAAGWQKVAADTWQYTISFTEDADWEVRDVQLTDLVQRQATAAGDVFTIDKTAPTMQVSFDNNNVSNGKYYNAKRTATITVTEHNFDAGLVNVKPTANGGNGAEVGQPQISGWSSNGDTHTATVTFPGQGVYTLSVDGQDLATNALTPYTSPEFVVDTIKPEIKIGDVENKTAYAGDIAPTTDIHDTNLDPSSTIEVSKISYPLTQNDPNPYTAKPKATATDMTVSYADPDKKKENDGVYTIMVTAKDLAGNTDTQALTWSVNRFGSTYVISDTTGKMLDQYLKTQALSDVTVTEINPSGLDGAQTSIELTRDTKNTTLKSNEDYQTAQKDSTGWQEYTYTVDKANYAKKDGVYRVLFHSKDAAGNTSENTMDGKNAKDEKSTAEVNFAVDDTAPTISFADLDAFRTSDDAYQETSHTGKVTFDDNLKLDHAEIKVDGKTVAKFDAKQLESSPIQEVKLEQSNAAQKVTAVAYDAAGNKSDEKSVEVMVTTDAFTLWLHNVPMMIATFVGIAALAGIIAFFATKRKKGDSNDNTTATA